MKNAANCVLTCELQDTWTLTFWTHIAVHTDLFLLLEAVWTTHGWGSLDYLIKIAFLLRLDVFIDSLTIIDKSSGNIKCNNFDTQNTIIVDWKAFKLNTLSQIVQWIKQYFEYIFLMRPQLMWDYSLNLSILMREGKEIN